MSLVYSAESLLPLLNFSPFCSPILDARAIFSHYAISNKQPAGSAVTFSLTCLCYMSCHVVSPLPLPIQMYKWLPEGVVDDKRQSCATFPCFTCTKVYVRSCTCIPVYGTVTSLHVAGSPRFSSMIQHLLQSHKRLLVKRPRVDLHGTIFAYNCCMRLAHVMSATRIVSSNVPHLHNMKNVVGF